MNLALANILGLYAGLLLMNALISGFMWWTTRSLLNRDLAGMWAAMLLGFMFQGAASALFEGNHLIIVLSFSTVFFANLMWARLVTRLVGWDVPLKSSVAIMAAGIVLAVAANAADAHFTLIALPVAIGVVYPAMRSAIEALWFRWADLTITGRAMLFSCLAVTLHELDYPFLRHLPEYSAMGFTIAIVVVFAYSIFGPAVVLEVLTRETATVAAEMNVARAIQMRVLPSAAELADVPDLEIQGFMRPADEVGGDYYDVCQLGDTSWILVGDVTGHGLSSGLVMLMAQSVIASILHTRGEEISPAELTYLANRVLFRNLVRLGDMRSMTIVALRKEASTQTFRYSGNHDHLYIYRAATGRVEMPDVDQVPHDLGFIDEFPASEFSESSFELFEGDLLLMATDGVTEAAKQGEYDSGMFESERVSKLLCESCDHPLASIRDRLLGELETFTGGIYHDDVTFVLARPIGATA